jgi:hypothetical protein
MRTHSLTRLAVLVLLASCARPGPEGTPPIAAGPVLPWIADDYPKALAEARARKLPLFVDSWAPW